VIWNEFAEMAAIIEEENQRLGLPSKPIRRFRGAILAIHGIMSLGDWLSSLAPHAQSAFYLYLPVHWGWRFPLTPFPFMTRFVVARLQREYDRARQRGLDVSAIGHSYGSLAIGHLLWRKPNVTLKRVILFGSILSRDFPWHSYLSTHRVEAVRNEVAGEDRWPWVAPTIYGFIKQVGRAGVLGFASSDPRITQRFHPGCEHSDLQTEEWMANVWMRFIEGEEPTIPDGEPLNSIRIESTHRE
jgi:hypothetical protein